MRFKVLVYTICIFVIMLLQTTVLEHLKVYGVKPNLYLVFLIAVALLRGNAEGAAVGFFCGLAHDALSSTVLGFHTLLGMYLGLLIGSINKRLFRENFIVIIFFTFASTVVYEFAVFFLTSLGSNIDFAYGFSTKILPEAIYNSVVSILVFAVVIRLNDRFDEISKAARKY